MKTAVKRTSDEKKQELEKRILDVLTEVFKDAVPVFLADLSSQEEFVFGITRDQLYFRTDAAKYGSAAVFNSVVAELMKIGLVAPCLNRYGQTTSFVGLHGELLEKTVVETLTPFSISIPENYARHSQGVIHFLYNHRARMQQDDYWRKKASEQKTSEAVSF